MIKVKREEKQVIYTLLACLKENILTAECKRYKTTLELNEQFSFKQYKNRGSTIRWLIKFANPIQLAKH